MQIGTNYSFQRSIRLMGDLSSTTQRLQTEIATGIRLSSPSIDPVASSRVGLLKQSMSDNAQYASNITLAASLLDASDTALASVETQIQRARELALRASNDTFNASDRAAIGSELQQIVDDLYTIANSTDVRGTPLFGGAGNDPAFTRDATGAVSYAGVGEPPRIPIANGASIAATDSGARVFAGIQTPSGPSDIFAIVSDLAAALAPGGSATPADLRAALDAGIDGLGAASEHVTTARASVGARGARLELESERLASLANENEIERGNLEGVDLETSIAQLQATMLTLQATQASFGKLSQMSLFDYL